jgi:hypothetical protein
MKQENFTVTRVLSVAITFLVVGQSLGQFVGFTPSGRIDPNLLNGSSSNYNPRAVHEETERIIERHRLEDEARERNEIAEGIKLMEQVRNYYNSFAKYPVSIGDGWHEVVIVDEGRYEVVTVKAYVYENKFRRFEQENCKYVPQTIINGKCKLHLTFADGEMRFVEVFFLNYIASAQ